MIVASVLLTGVIGAPPLTPAPPPRETSTAVRLLASGVAQPADTDTDSNLTLCRVNIHP